ncbi:MAG: class I SAM-dependent methyltransferase [Cyanothece sp. SIO2G6]|nr:class I SAM-dependent methyltransferase [Cyanothece sp. SIO2G6]
MVVNTKAKVDLGVVQETLLVPLWARAEELKQPDKIIFDPLSAEIVAAIDYDFAKLNLSYTDQITCCLLHWIMDEWAKDYLQQYPQGVIVELGVGLNTRFDRLDNGTVRWFEIDLPDTMALRQQFFQETERRKFIAASALDTDWCDLVKEVASGQPCLFIVEGLLFYLLEEQVKQIFANLLEHFSGSKLAFDCVSPFLVNRHFPDNMAAKHKWGIGNLKEIETWNSHYKLLEVRTCWDAPKQYVKRFPWFSVFFHLPVLRDFYRMALFGLT